MISICATRFEVFKVGGNVLEFRVRSEELDESKGRQIISRGGREGSTKRQKHGSVCGDNGVSRGPARKAIEPSANPGVATYCTGRGADRTNEAASGRIKR